MNTICPLCISKFQNYYCINCNIHVDFLFDMSMKKVTFIIIYLPNYKNYKIYLTFNVKDKNFILRETLSDLSTKKTIFTLNNMNINSLNNYIKNYFLL